MLTIYEIVDGLCALLEETSLSLTEEQLDRYKELENEYYLFLQASGREG